MSIKGLGFIGLDPAKTYRTRDGREVRIYATDGREGGEIHGAIKRADGWEYEAWRADGAYYYDGEESDFDLVEVKPERSGWVNVYADDFRHFATSSHATRQDADRAALDDRIACLHLTFREGDGLEGK